jgi:hypothetical protein
MKYRIKVSGCDDSTYINRDLTEQEYAFLVSIAADITEASTYGCMPTMTLIDYETVEKEAAEEARLEAEYGI